MKISKAKRKPSIWTIDKIIEAKIKYNVGEAYLCRRNGADALFVESKSGWSMNFAIVQGSKLGKPSKGFYAKGGDNAWGYKCVEAQMRRTVKETGMEKNGVMLYETGFASLGEAARFANGNRSLGPSSLLRR